MMHRRSLVGLSAQCAGSDPRLDTEFDTARRWLGAAARASAAARIEALQEFICVLAAELDTEAELLRESGESHPGQSDFLVAEGMARSASYLRDTAGDVAALAATVTETLSTDAVLRTLGVAAGARVGVPSAPLAHGGNRGTVPRPSLPPDGRGTPSHSATSMIDAVTGGCAAAVTNGRPCELRVTGTCRQCGLGLCGYHLDSAEPRSLCTACALRSRD